MRRRPWRRHPVVCCPPHVRLYLDAAGQLANDPSIQGEAWRALLLLLSLVDDDNRAVVSTTELAGHLTMPRQNIWRAMTQLAQVDCVRRVFPRLYQLSPHVANRSLLTPEDRPQPPYMRAWQTDSVRQLAADKTTRQTFVCSVGC